MISKNQEALKQFSEYCSNHPEERFWQALRNWAEVSRILVYYGGELEVPEGFHDTFYDEK